MSHKRSHNSNIAARLAAKRQWRYLMDRRRWQHLTGHHRVKLTDRRRVSPKPDLRDRV